MGGDFQFDPRLKQHRIFTATVLYSTSESRWKNIAAFTKLKGMCCTAAPHSSHSRVITLRYAKAKCILDVFHYVTIIYIQDILVNRNAVDWWLSCSNMHVAAFCHICTVNDCLFFHVLVYSSLSAHSVCFIQTFEGCPPL